MKGLASADLPSNITANIIPAPPKDKSVNFLLLLHGLGDTHLPFTNFARRMALPETIAVSIRGPSQVPYLENHYHWADDAGFEMDPSIGQYPSNGPSFSLSNHLIGNDIIRHTIVTKTNYMPCRNIIILGYGQGGSAALSVAISMGKEELGGIISIGGCLPANVVFSSKLCKLETPILICKGGRDSNVSDAEILKIKAVFKHVEVTNWPKSGDGMPGNSNEMLPIMRFFSRRLLSMKGVPEGSIQL